jgi:hypothetical protein
VGLHPDSGSLLLEPIFELGPKKSTATSGELCCLGISNPSLFCIPSKGLLSVALVSPSYLQFVHFPRPLDRNNMSI